MFAEQVSDDFVVDMSGLPSLLPTPLSEYMDFGNCITHEIIRTNERTRAIFRRTIRKDSEEYRKAIEQGRDLTAKANAKTWTFEGKILGS